MHLNKNITEEVKEIKGSIGKEFLNKKKEIVKELARLLENAVDKRAENKIGIAFSGGVDSTLLAFLCSKLNKKFKLYSVGLQGSKDLESAAHVAFSMKWPIKYKIITLGEAEKIIKEVVSILPEDKVDVVNVGVGCVTYSVLKMAKEEGMKTVMTGLGSEEIFAGYERHKQNIKNLQEESWNGLLNIWERDLVRDTSIADVFKIKVECPFLDKNLVEYAMKIEPKLKINDEMKKVILRESAVFLGLKKEFAFRKKLAAQYGSSFDKALEKLAKKNGFKYKKDYLENLR